MNLNTFTPVLALAVVIERVVEAVFNFVEALKPVQAWVEADKAKADPNYPAIKQVITFLVSIIAGVWGASLLNLAIFSTLEGVQIDQGLDRLLSGALAGAAAPYSHQLIEALFNFQKLIQGFQKGKNVDVEARRQDLERQTADLDALIAEQQKRLETLLAMKSSEGSG